MRLVDLWSSKSKPTISFETFPPKTEKAAGNLESVIDALDEGDRDALLEFGIDYATRQCEELLGSGVYGLPFTPWTGANPLQGS